MKRLLAVLIAMWMTGDVAHAAFATNLSTKVVALDALTDDFTDFRFRWTGYDSQDVKFTVETTSGTGYVMTGYTATFKATKRASGATNVVYISKGTSDCTISLSNVTFTVAYSNVPPNGTYNAELLLIDSANGLYRTLARGTIFVRESLYASDGSDFPYPSLTASFADLTDVSLSGVAQGDVLYRGATMWNNLAAGTSGYVLTTAGAGANPSWTAKTSDSTYTNYLEGDTEIVVTGAARSGSNVLSIGSTIARDTEVNSTVQSATGTLYTTAAAAWTAADTAAITALSNACVTLWQADDLTVSNACIAYTVSEAQALSNVVAVLSEANTFTESQLIKSQYARGWTAQKVSADGLTTYGQSQIYWYGANYYPAWTAGWLDGATYKAASIYWAPYHWTVESNLVVEGSISQGGATLDSTYLQLAGGLPMTGALSLGSNQNINLVYLMQLINADPTNPGLGYGGIKWQDGSTYLEGNANIPGTDAGRIVLGFSGSDVWTFCQTNLNSGTADLVCGGTIYQGGSSLAATYLGIAATAADSTLFAGATAAGYSNAVMAAVAASYSTRTDYDSYSLFPTSGIPAWQVLWGASRDEDCTLTGIKGYAHAGTCVVHIIEAVSNTTWGTWTTNATITATTEGAYSTTFTDAAIGAGNWYGVLAGAYDPACSNVSITVKLTW